jgi:hypothetical protein
MTTYECKLDNQHLEVLGWSWGFSYLGSQTSEWSQTNGGEVKRVIDTVGMVVVHKIRCVEKGVAWTSSKAKYFKSKIKNGTTIVLNSNLDVYNTEGDVNVKVLDCSGEGSAGGAGEANAGIRYFTLTVQEV